MTGVRVVGSVLATTLAVPVVVLVGARVVGAGRSFPLAALLTVLPYLLLLGALLVPLAWRLGPRPVAVALTLAVAVGGALQLPRVLPSDAPTVDGPMLTVAVANLRAGGGDAATIVAHVDRHRIDVLLTLELTEPSIARLSTAGLDDRLPHTALRPSGRTSGGGIHSRVELDRGPDTSRGGFGATPSATLTVDGAPPVELHGVHPLPPISADWTRAWDATLGGLPRPDDTLRVLAGDLNATHDHAPFRDLLRAGYVDAAAARGQAWRPTFSGLADGDPVPPVTLDHVLVDPRIAVRSVRVVPLPGSDHRMLIAELQLPAA